MIDNDKVGQTPTKFDNVVDKKIESVCVMNVHKGNRFVLASCDPTQPQPIRGRPFMVSPCVIPCYKIISIKDSVRAQYEIFQDSTDF